MLSRRQFGGSVAAASFFAALNAAAQGHAAAEAAGHSRKKIAFLGTDVYRHSHAQHFLDRFALGFATGGKWVPPQV
jgi:hypothetical protein